MDDKRFRLGMALTIAWLAAMIGFLFMKSVPDKLNEWGDFFAGFFAPLAFLWLVLGYLQQGVELRNSTRALELQADELRNSVKAQSELVEVSRKQLEQEIESLKEERQLRQDAARPKVVATLGMTRKTANMFTQEILLTNSGGHAWNVRADAHSSHDPRSTNHTQWTSLSTMKIDVVFHNAQETIPVSLSMSCQDGSCAKWVFEASREGSNVTLSAPTLAEGS